MKGRDNMKHNKVFKEEEVRIIEVAGRPYISMDDWDRILSDLFFTKCDLETHTLRVIKRLGASIALSYKALRDNQQLDLNEELAIVPLSKKKIQDLIIKGLKISKKDKEIQSELDELEDYLASEEPSLNISKEETEELIHDSIHEALEPYITLLKSLNELKPKQNTPKPKKTVKKEDKDLILDITEEEDNIDYESIANEE